LPSATALLPEYANVLARSGNGNQATEVITTYLARRAKDGKPLGLIERNRIDQSLDALVGWGETHAELYGQLKEFRNTGIVSGDLDGAELDSELMADLDRLQGQWEWKETVDEKTTHMVIDIQGTEVTTKWLKPDGSVERGRNGVMKLGRSGAVKMYTVSLGGITLDGTSFIYTLTADEFICVSGMLINHGSLPDTKMMNWTRVVAEETE
jgi:hypothetical protein